MSQISPPMRILLVGSIVFLAAWFAFLRPGGETDAPAPVPAGNVNTPAPAQTSAGQAVEQAQGAAAAAEGAAAAPATGAPATGAAPSQAPAAPSGSAAPEDSLAETKLPKPVKRALARDKVLVLFVWNPKAADDRQVRRELRKIDLHGGQVKVHVADVRRIARYAPITRGVNVDQSPSIVVIDPDRKGTLLAGFVDRPTIDQAVADALGDRAGIAARPVNAYFKSVDRMCAQAQAEMTALPRPSTPAQLVAYMGQAAAISTSFDRKFAKLDTPAKHKGFAKKFARQSAKGTKILTKSAVEARGVKDAATALAFQQRFDRRAAALRTEARREFGQYGIAACVS